MDFGFVFFFFPLRSLINPGRVYDLEQTVGIENLGSEAEKLLGKVIRVMHKFCICSSVLGSTENENNFGEVVHSGFYVLQLFFAGSNAFLQASYLSNSHVNKRGTKFLKQ